VLSFGGTRPPPPLTHLKSGTEVRVAQTFEAWRIDLLFPEKDARRRLAEAVADIRSYGGPEMLMPGEREARHKADAEKNGIPYELSQWETLRRLGADTGVATAQRILEDVRGEVDREGVKDPADVRAILRRELISIFYDRLLPGGYLMLGHSESLLHLTTAFELIQLSSDLVYRKPLSALAKARP